MTYMLYMSRLTVKEKQHLISGSLDVGSGFLREQPVRMAFLLLSNAIWPNFSQYDTSEPSAMISCNAMTPYTIVNDQHKDKTRETNISEFGHWHMDQLRHLLVTPVYLSCSSPATSRNCHAREDAIVFHQTLVKPHLYTHKLHICQSLRSLAKLWSEPVQLSQDSHT